MDRATRPTGSGCTRAAPGWRGSQLALSQRDDGGASLGSGVGDCDLPAARLCGTYEFRLFANNGYGRMATSATVVVSASMAVIAVNGVTPPDDVSAGVGTNATVSISNGPGNATDWVGCTRAAPRTARFSVGAISTGPQRRQHQV